MMNRFKISFAAMAVILGLSAAFAFKSDAKKVSRKPLATVWFTYNGSGSLTSPANYTFAGDRPDCEGSDEVCGLQAPEDASQKPVISPALSSEISNAASTHTPTANVTLHD
jgi:hypothetical protein